MCRVGVKLYSLSDLCCALLCDCSRSAIPILLLHDNDTTGSLFTDLSFYAVHKVAYTLWLKKTSTFLFFESW